MDIDNRTPFAYFHSRSLNSHGEFFDFCVMRGTYQITADGRLDRAASQVPPALTDGYYGDPLASSLRIENDLAPYKPRADIYFVDPVARSPEGGRQASWPVSVRVGPLHLQATVTGERTWTNTLLGGWNLSEPTPCDAVLLRFETAYGGASRSDPADRHPANPIGRGYCSRDELSRPCQLPSPQVLSHGPAPVRPGGSLEPIVLTPVHRGWAPRNSLGGTYDESWKATKWPLAPDDFRYDFYNCAPAALQLSGYLAGDEAVEVSGVGRRPGYRFSLPETRRPVLMMLAGSRVYLADFALDTLILDLEAEVVSLVWRAAFLRPSDVDAARLTFKE